jgi:hypothetical protein
MHIQPKARRKFSSIFNFVAQDYASLQGRGVRNVGVLRANNPTKIFIQKRFVLHFGIADK